MLRSGSWSSLSWSGAKNSISNWEMDVEVGISSPSLHILNIQSQQKRPVLRTSLPKPSRTPDLPSRSSQLCRDSARTSSLQPLMPAVSHGPAPWWHSRGKHGWAAHDKITLCGGLWNVECGLNHSAVPRGETADPVAAVSRDSSRGTGDAMPDPSSRPIDRCLGCNSASGSQATTE